MILDQVVTDRNDFNARLLISWAINDDNQFWTWSKV
jgi:hypothetical protein